MYSVNINIINNLNMDVTKKCIPCQGGIPKLNSEEINSYLSKIDKDWKVEDDKLYKYFDFTNTKSQYILQIK